VQFFEKLFCIKKYENYNMMKKRDWGLIIFLLKKKEKIMKN